MPKNKSILFLVLLIFFCSSIYSADNSRILKTNLLEPATLDPTQCWDSVSSIYIHNIYDTLLSYNPKTLEIRPNLAVNWQPRDNNKIWIFDLRKGVYFHDGTEFTADSVVFTFRRGQEKDFKYRYYDLPGYLGLMENLKEIKKINKYRVKFIFNSPFSPFLQSLTSPIASIVSPAAVKKYKKNFPENPVGTGPYKLKKWEKGENIILEANDNYWKNKPYFKTINNRFFVNIDKTVDLIREKKLDLTLRFSISKMESIKHLNWLKIKLEPEFSTLFFAINTKNKPLNNIYFRKALNHLWNKSYVKFIFQKYAIPTDSLLPQGMPGYNKQKIIKYPFSIKKAKNMLEKANISSKIELNFLAYKKISSLYLELLSFFSRSLNKVGINLRINKVELRDYNDYVSSGKYDLTFSGWIADYIHTHSFFSPLFSEKMLNRGFANLSLSKSKKIELLLNKAKTEFDKKKRGKIYEKINTIVNEKALTIPISQQLKVIILNKKIDGLVSTNLGLISFSKARINENTK